MEIAAIYARVSSDQQKDDNTIASQTAALIELPSPLLPVGGEIELELPTDRTVAPEEQMTESPANSGGGPATQL